MEPAGDPTTAGQGASTAPTQNSNSHKTLYSVIVLVVIVLLGIGWWFYSSYSAPKNLKSELKGEIYLTLRTDDDAHVAGLFAYDLNKYEGILLLDDDNLNVTEHISPDGKMGVFSSVPVHLLGTDEGRISQLYTVNLSSGEKKQITHSTTTALKKNPEWSPDGTRIAFMAKVGSASLSEGAVPASNFSVFVTDLSGNEKFITKGILPQWTPDGKLVVLKDDGLHLYDLVTRVDTLIWKVQGGSGHTNMKIDISRDGSMIAWSFPDTGKIILMKILSWESFGGEIVKTIDTHGFWVVFSPDSKYLAVQEVSWSDVQDNPEPRLVVYEVDTERSTQILDLQGYDQEAMFVTDWRY